MINPKELMIGSWVEHNSNWSYRNQDAKKSFLFQWEASDWYAIGECTMQIEDINPILLSLDIIEKAGFKRSNEDNIQHFMLDEVDLRTLDNDFSVLKYKVGRGNISIGYFHQLQNLYFNLTRKELNINL